LHREEAMGSDRTGDLDEDLPRTTRKERHLLLSVERGVLLRVEAAAILLGIGRTKMYDLIGRGEIPVVRIGRRTLIHRNDLEQFAQERRNRQADAGRTPT
jgi:excisionase family DNA binding protein